MAIDRRHLILAGAGAALTGCASTGPAQPMAPVGEMAPQYPVPPVVGPGYGAPGYGAPPYRGQPYGGPGYAAPPRAETYQQDEIVHNVSNFFGVTSETVGGAVEHVFRDQGQPTGYIAGEEGSGAFILGLRYGKGLLYMKHRPPVKVYWRGPTAGFDFGGNASRVFTLCYNLQYPDAIFQRFPGVEGSLYVVAGIGLNYQSANDIVLAPMRTGVGLRAGASVGYLAYSRSAHLEPF